MSEQEKQDGQKTVVAFVAGLLIGGLLVWMFTDTAPVEAPDDAAVEEAADEEVADDSDEEQADSDTEAEESTTTDESTPTASEVENLPTGDGSVTVNDQPAGTSVVLEGATFPTDEGWIGVRDYQNDQLGNVLGVVRYSKEQGLVPSAITLRRATEAGESYAIVFFEESGDREFSLANDAQIEGIFGTFTAQ